ncbi:hypothetical protein CRG98_001985 [Punica granatum]|uniref:Retrotransposon gag domain-containing protein n=1 Tax=Punica granatum TaxID=22663 RepID=A0A2I0LAD8_PUNGR|nr:hypothetical protein CRG98_001985 [Punica granatum]
MAEEQQLAVFEHDTPPMPAHSPSPSTHVIPPPIPAVVSVAYSGAPSAHLPPLAAQTPTNFIDPLCFTALEGMVNQLAANMNTNMAELMGMLRDQNRSSSSYTPPPEHRPTVDPNPIIPLIYVTDSEDISFYATKYMPAVYPERRMRRMKETIRALQAGTSRLDYGDFNWNLLPSMRLPPKIKIPDFKRYDGTKDPRHHLHHFQSKMLQYWDYEEFAIQTFQDSLMGPALDWFMTLKPADILTWADLS